MLSVSQIYWAAVQTTIFIYNRALKNKQTKGFFKQLGLLNHLHPCVLSELLILSSVYARTEAVLCCVSDTNSSLSCSLTFSPSPSFTKILFQRESRWKMLKLSQS